MKKKRVNIKNIIILSLTLLSMIIIIAVIISIVTQKNKSNAQSNSPSRHISKTVNQPINNSELISSSESNKTSSFNESKQSVNTTETNTNNHVIQDAYFDDALFIGDSRTEGLKLFNILPNATFYTAKGMTVTSIYTTKSVKSGDSKITIMDAIKQKPFGKVYIMLGINELGWVYDSIFVEKYGNIINEIKQSQPNTKIYLQSLLPVTTEKSDSDKTYNNTNIRKFNQLIQKLAQDKKVIFIDTYQSVVNQSAALPKDAATDGVHLTKEYCYKWAEYISKNK